MKTIPYQVSEEEIEAQKSAMPTYQPTIQPPPEPPQNPPVETYRPLPTHQITEPRKPELPKKQMPKKLKEHQLEGYPHKVHLIGKKTFVALIVIIVILSLLLIANLFWFNFSIADGKFGGNVTVNNDINVEPAQITVPIENKYDHAINVENKIELSDDKIDSIIDDIVDGVVGEINVTA